jgi:hypothetical protein
MGLGRVCGGLKHTRPAGTKSLDLVCQDFSHSSKKSVSAFACEGRPSRLVFIAVTTFNRDWSAL